MSQVEWVPTEVCHTGHTIVSQGANQTETPRTPWSFVYLYIRLSLPGGPNVLKLVVSVVGPRVEGRDVGRRELGTLFTPVDEPILVEDCLDPLHIYLGSRKEY